MNYLLKPLLYLWTRDGEYPVGEDTRNQVQFALRGMLMQHSMGKEGIYSDKDREKMAEELAEEFETFTELFEAGKI